MDALGRTWTTILSSLRGLSTTARLLIGSLAVILVMTLFLVALYAGDSKMSPLPISLDAETKAKAISYLEREQIPHSLRGGELVVPSDRRYSVLAELTGSDVVSSDKINFLELIQDDNPFASSADKRNLHMAATMEQVEMMLEASRDVEEAELMISDPPGQVAIGRPNQRSSASVTIRLVGGQKLSKSRAESIALTVAGAHASLTADRVTVTDTRTGQAFTPRTEQDMSSSKYMEIASAIETKLEDKIYDHLNYIPGVRVSVNAQVDATHIEQQSNTIDDAKTAPLAESTRLTTTKNTTASNEAGVRPNTGMSIGGGRQGGSESSDERTDSRIQPVFGGNTQHMVDPGGHPQKINASIQVPRSYLASIYKNRQDDPEAAPSDVELEPIETEVLTDIEEAVKPLIETDTFDGAVAGTVVVKSYADFVLASSDSSSATGVGAGLGGSMAALPETLIRYVTVGGLGVISLAMMLLMVRRASVREELPSPEELAGIPPAIEIDDSDMVGEAAETPTPLEGLEIDEEQLRRQQMLEQINDLAVNSGEAAASLLRKWIHADQ